MIGILGGMGPLATSDFFAKVIVATTAKHETDHVPLLIQSDPRIPGRPAALLRGGPSPLPALREGRDRLIKAGALALAMPCNTAHAWLAELREACPVPFLSIVEASCNEARSQAAGGASVGLIGTEATLACHLFDGELKRHGLTPLLPKTEELRDWILPAIEDVKMGSVARGGANLEKAVQSLLDRGAAVVILACTETPMALDAIASPLRAHCIDTNAALARACVAWWNAHLQQNEISQISQ
jgi:aspartate racemase